MNGGAGLRLLFFVPTSVTIGRLACRARTCVSAVAPSPISGFAPSIRTRSASSGEPSGAMQARHDRPVLAGGEGADLPLALDDETHGNRLDPPGRQARAHLARDERAQGVPHQAVDDPACLLRIHEIAVDLARVSEGVADRRLGDLAERDPGQLVRREARRLRDVPGDRLALAIEVGRQEDPLGRSRRLLDRADVLARPLVGDHVLGGEVVVHVHAELALPRVLRQVADVAVRGKHGVTRPEVAFDRPGLGGRLDDDEVSTHGARV